MGQPKRRMRRALLLRPVQVRAGGLGAAVLSIWVRHPTRLQQGHNCGLPVQPWAMTHLQKPTSKVLACARGGRSPWLRAMRLGEFMWR